VENLIIWAVPVKINKKKSLQKFIPLSEVERGAGIAQSV
jgi:hypothetical protein